MAERAYLLLLVVALFTTAVLCMESLRRGFRMPTHRALLAGCAALNLWVLGTLVEHLASSPAGHWTGLFLIYSGAIAVPPAWYILCQAIVSGDPDTRGATMSLWYWLGLWLPAIVFWFALVTNPLHGGFIRGGQYPDWEYGPLWWALNVYGFLVIGRGLFALVQYWRLAPHASGRASLWPLVGAVLLTLLGCWAWIIGLVPPAYNPSAPAFSLIGLVVGFTILRSDYLDVLPLSAFAIFEHLGDGVVILDAQERIVSANHAAVRYLGLAAHETAGARFRDVAYVRFGWQEPPDEFFAGKRVRAEVTDDADPLVLAVQRVRVSPKEDATVHTAVHLRDITVEYQVEQDLRRSETTYRLLYTDALDAIFTLNTMGHIIAANPATERLGGYCQDDWDNMSFTDVILPESMDTVTDTYERLLQGEEVTGVEYGMRCKNGDPLYLSANLRPVMQDGRVVRIEGIARDITSLRAAAKQEERLQAQLAHEQKLAALGRMLAGVAHELNNPLTGILGYAELLTRTVAPTADAHRFAQRILGGAEQCQAIVADLLRFAQNRPIQAAPCRLVDCVRHARDAEGDALAAHDIVVDIEIDDTIWVLVDHSQLQLCLANLLVNARDALLDVASHRRIRLRAVDNGERVQMTVEDTGPGIRPDVAARMFDPFFTTKDLGRGTGLGLSLCHTTMENLSGSIRYDSTYTDGARFVLDMPQAAPQVAPAAPKVDAPLPKAGARVILADDNADVRDFCSACLSAAGFEVLPAADGRAVVDLLTAGPVDVIVSDIRMPFLDGPALYDHLRNLHDAPPIVFVTGDAVREETRTFLNRTGSPCLLKPFRSAQLIEIVERTLAQSASARSAA